jgi:hypothetical protein
MEGVPGTVRSAGLSSNLSDRSSEDRRGDRLVLPYCDSREMPSRSTGRPRLQFESQSSALGPTESPP